VYVEGFVFGERQPRGFLFKFSLMGKRKEKEKNRKGCTLDPAAANSPTTTTTTTTTPIFK
jgi:hypothetical protein